MRILLPCILFGACTDYSVVVRKPPEEQLHPVIRVEPASANFGQLTSQEEAQVTFTITNTGFAPLQIDDIDLVGPNSYGLLGVVGLPLVLERDQTSTFDVIFAPREGGALEGEVLVLSDALNTPELVLPLTGDGAVAELLVTPNPIELGEHYIPCDTSRQVVLENVGTEPLVVSDIAYFGQVEQYAIQGLPALPFTITPGQQLPVYLTYAPRQRGDADATWEITSNALEEVTSVDLHAHGQYGVEFAEQFVVPEVQPVNLIFAVDQSGSMSNEATMLSNEFASFIQTLSAATQDWKVGVVTLDTGCFNSGILTATTPNVTGLFTTAVQQGDDGQYYTERLLELTRLAMNKDLPGQCNAGFRDANAPLHVIMVSDERDQSANSWSYYLNHYSAYAGDPSLLTVHAVVDLNTQCGGTGASDAGPGGYYETAVATGGQVLNICSTSWAGQLSWIAQQAVANIGVYDLAMSGADPSSIEVLIDGSPMVSGWHYDPARNAIVMDVELLPNQVIDVLYGVSPTCP